jgi:hypothetical protein
MHHPTVVSDCNNNQVLEVVHVLGTLRRPVADYIGSVSPKLYNESD